MAEFYTFALFSRMGWLKFTKLGRGITLGTPDIITGNDVTDYFRSATRPPFWFFTLCRRSPKRLSRISPNLIGWTYKPSDIFAWNNDVINCFRSAAVAILKKNFFGRNRTTGPRVTKFDTEVHHNTLVNFTENDGASYFRSSTIRHFDFLHYAVALLNGSTELHQIW